MPIGQLEELERKLSALSHSEEAIKLVQDFSHQLKRTAARVDLFNATDAILRRPIEPGDAAALGFTTPDDLFVLLQGDIVSTESAYFYGERVTGAPKYAALNSSCDLVPHPSNKHAALFRISEVRRNDLWRYV